LNKWPTICVTDSGAVGQGYMFLPRHSDTRSFPAHLTLFVLHRQWRRNWQEWWKSWQTMENRGHFFHMFNFAYSRFYNPSEHLAFDKVIVCLNGMAVFKLCVLKIQKHFRIKIYKLHEETGFTWHEVYWCEDRQCTPPDLTVTCATVTMLTRRINGNGHILIVNSFFFISPESYKTLTKQTINCCSMVTPNCNGMPHDFRTRHHFTLVRNLPKNGGMAILRGLQFSTITLHW
jgi:hypothetical protein